MSSVIVSLVNYGCKESIKPETKEGIVNRAKGADFVLMLACAILGGLGAGGVMAMPAAAAYALIGVAGGIAILYVIRVCVERRQEKQRHLFSLVDAHVTHHGPSAQILTSDQ